MKLFIYISLVSAVFPFRAFAGCDDVLRDGSYRESPTDGRAKEGRVEYKLINQLLISLRQAVRESHPLPEGFRAELAPAVWPDAPVGGVRLYAPNGQTFD